MFAPALCCLTLNVRPEKLFTTPQNPQTMTLGCLCPTRGTLSFVVAVKKDQDMSHSVRVRTQQSVKKTDAAV